MKANQLTPKKLLEMIASRQISPEQGVELFKKLGEDMGEGQEQKCNFCDDPSDQLLYYVPAWRRKDAEGEHIASASPTLIFDTDEALFLKCREQSENKNIILVRPGEAYQDTDNNVYTLCPENEDDYRVLVQTLSSKNALPGNIIYLWSKAGFTTGLYDSGYIDNRLSYSIYPIFFLTRAMMEQKPKTGVRLIYVYQNEIPPDPFHLAMGGFAKTVCMEHPKFIYKTLGISDLSETESVLNKISGEFGADHTAVTIRYDQEQRFVSAFQEKKFPLPETVVNKGGIWLITGGMGGLGLIFAEYLARKGDTKLVLTGRSALGDEKKDRLRKLRELTADAEYIQADVSKPEEVQKLVSEIRSRFGNLSGIFHAAGVIRDALIPKKTKTDIDEVSDPKIRAVIYLDEATKDEPLDAFVLFSSVTSVIGNAGQCDYAYGNAFMDHFAEKREYMRQEGKRQGKTLSINWPLWKSGGMTVPEQTERWLTRTQGISLLPTEEGLAAFEKGLAGNAAQMVLFRGNPEKIRRFMGIKESKEESKADSLFRSANLSYQNRPFLQKSETSDESDLSSLVQKGIIKIVSSVLKVEEAEIDPEAEMSEYGFDSIGLTTLVNQINETYSLELMPAIFFEHSSAASFAQYLCNDYKDIFRKYYREIIKKSDAVCTEIIPEERKADSLFRSANLSYQNRPFLQKSETSDESDLSSLVQKGIIKIVSSVLKVEEAEIDPEAEMSEYGFDSIGLTTLVNQINETYSLELMPAIFFEHSSAASFAQYLCNTYSDTFRRHYQKQLKSDPTESQVTVSETAGKRRKARFLPAKRKSEAITADFTSHADDDPAAVIGMSGIMPRCNDLDEFWNHLKNGDDLITEIPADRWDWKSFYGDPLKDPDCTDIIWGGFMNTVDRFDPSFFSISPLEAELMDPQHRIFLETVWKCIEDAGYKSSDLSGTRTGVFAGISSDEYNDLLHTSGIAEVYTSTGTAYSVLTNRISYLLNLHGPSEPVDTACSSSLVALHRAVMSLRAGECDMAIAGGVNAILTPRYYIAFSKVGVLSHEGKCRTFDKGADGYVRSEGSAAVLLKPLSKALADKDHVYGIIRGTAVNHGGHVSSLTVPNPNAQAEVIVAAHRKAGIAPDSITYIEAHGTGTPLGDPVEVNGLKKAFKRLYEQSGKSFSGTKHCGLGSVKTNVGHLEAAAGIAGLIKVLLSMKYRTLPANIHFQEINPQIQLEDSPFYIVTETIPWSPLEQDIPLRAGVSSFGYGGANAHVVVEEVRGSGSGVRGEAGSHIIPLSAKSEERLRVYAGELAGFFEKQKSGNLSLRNVAYTLQAGREAMEERLALIVSDTDELREKLLRYAQGESGINHLYHGSVKRGSKNSEVESLIARLIAEKAFDKIAQQWVSGSAIDWTILYPSELPRRISLPTYPFAEERYWIPATSYPLSGKTAKTVTKESLLYYQPVWELSPDIGTATQSLSDTVLLFDSDEIRAKSFQNRLRHLICVRHGSQFEDKGDGTYQINPESPHDYVRLFNALKQRGIEIHSLVYLHGWVSPALQEKDGLYEGIYPIYHIVRAVSAVSIATLGRILFVFEQDKANPFAEAVSAYSGSIGFILPNLSLTTLRISANQSRNVSDGIIQELSRIPEPLISEVRYEDGKRYVRTVKPLNFRPDESRILPLKQNSVWLITGGAGGLGLIFAKYLAEKHRAKVILIGRSKLRGEKEERIRELRASGAKIEYIQADVTNQNAMTGIMETVHSKYGALNGVIHAAGISSAKLLTQKDSDEFEAVLMPKIQGVMLLDHLTKDEPLDFFILFSSTSALLGDFGQCDYAVANRFSDSYAQVRESLRHSGMRKGNTLVINWTLWRDGGMHYDKEQFYLETSGLSYMESDQGIEAFETILKSNVSQAVVFSGDSRRIEQLFRRESIGKPHIPQRHVRTPKHASHPDITGRIESDIRDIAAEIIRTDPQKLDRDESLAYFGFDSISFKILSNKIQETYSVAISPSVFFTSNTIRSLSAYLLENFEKQMKERYKKYSEEDRVQGAGDRVQGEELSSHNITTYFQSSFFNSEPVAVVGMHGVFPGSATLKDFWKHLESEHDLITEVPEERWNWKYYYKDPATGKERPYMKWGGFIADADCFDPLFFKISPREAEMMDPQQRIFIETVWKAVEDAGYKASALSGKNIAVFAGVQFNDYQILLGKHYESNAQAGPGNAHAMVSNRISFLMNWHGPSETINTACSGGLIAVHRAVRSLRSGECEMAVAGGVSLMLYPGTVITTGQLGMLSPDGRCKTFDKDANGFVKGEGAAALFLKPLGKAIADRDHIYAVIRGTAAAHGGKAASLTAPNSDAQADLLIAAYSDAGISFDTVSYLELHGTGTELGDPVEIAGIKRAYNLAKAETNYRCGLGSVKTNIGHLEPAAGIAGIVKVILSMQNRKLPGNPHFRSLNPYIDLGNTPFYVVGNTQEWESPRDDNGNPIPRRAGVSSFGFGGAYSHAVIEEYEKGSGFGVRGSGKISDTSHLILLSAKNKDRLCDYAIALNEFLLYENIQISSQTAGPGDIRGYVLKAVAEILNVNESDIDTDVDFAECGMDTVMLSVFCQKLNSRYETDITPALFRECSTIDSLIHYLNTHFSAANPHFSLLTSHFFSLPDIAYTLQVGREEMEERLALIVSDIGELKDKLSRYVQREKNIEGCYTGNVRSDKSVSGLLLEGREGEEFIRIILQEKKLGKLAQLWVQGAEIAWEILYPDHTPRRISLPTYPFAKERYWIPDDVKWQPSEIIGESHISVLHPLLGSNTSTLKEQKFSTRLTGLEFYLTDHVVAGEKTFPGVAYMEMAIAAGKIAGENPVRILRDMVWIRPLILSDDPKEIYICLYPDGDQKAAFEISSDDDSGMRQVHAQGKLLWDRKEDNSFESLHIAAIRSRCTRTLNCEDCYRFFQKAGLAYGPAFQALRELYYNENEALGYLELPEFLRKDFQAFGLHPSLTDGAFQTVSRLISDSDSPGTYIPFALGELALIKPLPEKCYAHAVRTGDSSDSQVKKFNIAIADQNGDLLAHIKDFSLRAYLESEDTNSLICFHGIWEERILSSQFSNLTSSVLLFDSDETVLRDRLKSDVILVTPGEAFEKLGSRHYRISPTDGNDYRQLLVSLAQEKQIPEYILHFWSQEDYKKEGLTLNSFYSLFHLSQALAEQKPVRDIRMLYVYKEENDSFSPKYAAMSGFAKTLRAEHPKLICKTVGMTDLSYLPEIVSAELQSDDGIEIVYRDGRRRVLCLKECESVPKSESGSVLKNKGVYVVTGGAGGLGLIFASYLAKQVKARLVLAGRSELNEEQSERIRKLEETGAEVMYIRADVSVQEDVKRLIAETRSRFQHINGIIHAAGLIRDAYILKKTPDEIAAVVAPKVFGTLYLDEAVKDEPLDFFVLFSSLAGVLGNAGQSDYAYANCFMDRFAEFREKLRIHGQRSGKTVSIDWPLWRDGGMQVDAHTEKFILRTTGMRLLKSSDGCEAFIRGLCSDYTQFMVTYGNPRQIRRIRKPYSLSEDIQQSVNYAESAPTVKTDGLEKRVITELLKIASEILKVRASEIDSNENLGEYGFDSINFTEFANRLNENFRLEITPALFFEYPSIRSFSQYLCEAFSAVFSDYYQDNKSHLVREERKAEPAPKARFQPQLSRDHIPDNRPGDLIAIIGMSAIMPQSENTEQFWKHLEAANDLISEVPEERWDWKSFFGDPEKEAGKTRAKWGGFIADAASFDNRFFNISPREAELMDPQQRLFLQTVWKTVEDAGYKPSDLSGTSTGLFVGVASDDYLELLNRQPADIIEPYFSTGVSHAVLANRISYLLNLHGPSEPIDTACSGALIAIHRAAEAIHSGSCNMAIAGGVHLMLTPTLTIAFDKAGMLSKEGRCKTFDSSANGYVRGEGVGAIFLKPLHQAEKDGDHIYAVIRGTAENHGGRASSLTAPNPKAQADLLIRAYTQAGIEPDTVSYIETHGTGTALGDPVEINGLKNAFAELYRKQGKPLPDKPHCGLGAVKTNIGHLESAAGIAGVIKVLLAMRHRRLPGMVHFKSLNPYIQLTGSPFYIVKESQDWIPLKDQQGQNVPRRAGVSSFGFGGANAHIILEEQVRGTGSEVRGKDIIPRTPHLILLSAKTEDRLRVCAEQLAAFIENEAENEEVALQDIAYTLQVGREAMEERLAFVVSDLEDAKNKLMRFLSGESDEFYRGNIRDKKAESLLIDGEAGQEILGIVIGKKDFGNIARLWVSGADIDWKLFYSDGDIPRRVSLPTYPFAETRHWIPISERKASEVRVSTPVYYRPVLEKTEIRGQGSGSRGTLLLFDNDDSRKNELEDSLKRPVIIVKPGETFTHNGDSSYEIRPDSEQDYIRLLTVFKQSGEMPETMLHLWTTGGETFPEADFSENHIADCLKIGIYSVHHLIRAISETGMNGTARFIFLSDKANPFTEAVAGYSKSLRHVLPNLSFSYIRILPGSNGKGLTDIVKSELSIDENEMNAEIRYEKGQRYVGRVRSEN